MNSLSCVEVQEQLDLLAADACDPPTRAALEEHLQNCSACAAGYAESQRLQGLLDLHWGQGGIERLQQRIAQEARPKRRRLIFTPLARGALAAAALLLITVGLTWWSWQTDGVDVGPQLALVVRGDGGPFKIDAAVPARSTDKRVETVAPATAPSGEALRQELLKAQRDGKLPAPPAVSLELALVNEGKRPALVRLGDVEPMLTLDVQGDGVLRLPAPDADPPAFLRPQSLQLKPGEQHIFDVDRLVAGSAGRQEYIYLTEPGEYTVTAHMRLTADGKIVTVTSAPIRIRVAK
jgi:hypothetical protein